MTEAIIQKKNLVILGSTGSIGKNVLNILKECNSKDLFPYEITGLAVGSDINTLAQQVIEWQPKYVAIAEISAVSRLRQIIPENITIMSGHSGIEELAALPEADIVVNAIAGTAGFLPSVSALKSSKKLLLANKESLVVGGSIIKDILRKNNGEIIPLDSEHSAIFQILRGEDVKSVNQVILTASGGPLLKIPLDKFPEITTEQVLKHPIWNMGEKITVDSATMMNKGLEVIEAMWLFDLPLEKTDVLIHPQSIVHSIVEFVDGTQKAQLAVPDMRIPIAYALSYPYRSSVFSFPFPNLAKIGTLQFEAVDKKRFPLFYLARQAASKGGTYPAVLNVSNEIAVSMFLKGEINILGIISLVSDVLDAHTSLDDSKLEDVLEACEWTKKFMNSLLKR